jgi:diguanylate cyclase (GGDEF)-like protein
MGDLVRALADVTKTPQTSEPFFFHLGNGAQDVRDRIAQHLDRALFESVVAAEVRSLASACSFPRLFDSLSQLVAQLVDYRWLSVVTTQPLAFAIHTNGRNREATIAEARLALSVPDTVPALTVLDADASDAPAAGRTIITDILLGSASVGRLAINSTSGDMKADTIAPLIARELGAAIRLATLVEESQRLAKTDGLTNLFNRRAFIEVLEREIGRCDRSSTPISVLLLDLDHFKAVNDTHGHGCGDAVLSAVSTLLKKQARSYDVAARWGGEEFVVALPDTTAAQASLVAERIRHAVEGLFVGDAKGKAIPLTVSIGVSQRQPHEPLEAMIDRADRAMYSAKTGGRNRVCANAEDPHEDAPEASRIEPLRATG